MPVGRRNVAVWDERRNTSRVTPPPPDALPNAVRALERFRVDEPALYGWVAAGAARLTHAEHRTRFGVDYTPSSSRRGRGRAG